MASSEAKQKVTSLFIVAEIESAVQGRIRRYYTLWKHVYECDITRSPFCLGLSG